MVYRFRRLRLVPLHGGPGLADPLECDLPAVHHGCVLPLTHRRRVCGDQRRVHARPTVQAEQELDREATKHFREKRTDGPAG